MRRIVIVLAGLAVVSIAAESRLFGQSSTASLSISATVSKNCTIATAAVAFGTYDSVTANLTAPLDGAGSVIVTCTKGAAAKVGLNAGANAAGATRQMVGTPATEHLTYELYRDSGHTQVWGNTAIDALDIPPALNQNAQTFPVYGRVAQAQVAAVGSYTDTVVATVNF